MVLVILSFVKDIGELLAAIGCQFCYLVHYGRNTNNIKTQFEKLKGTREDVEASVDELTTNGEPVKSEDEMWLRNVEAIITEVHELSDEVQANKRCFNRWCPNWTSWYILSKQAIQNVRPETG